eukprot:11349745-Alexandrium_andersonii.AAC.1
MGGLAPASEPSAPAVMSTGWVMKPHGPILHKPGSGPAETACHFDSLWGKGALRRAPERSGEVRRGPERSGE